MPVYIRSISHKYPFLLVLLVLMLSCISSLSGQGIDHWESIVAKGDSVRYLVPQSELPADWNTVNFDDSQWLEGISGVGYGDDDDNTIIDPCISVFVRYRFHVTEISVIEKLILDMDFDDSFVAYLNGTEIARENIGTPFIPPAFDEPANGFLESMLQLGQLPHRFNMNGDKLNLLLAGENVLAIQVHNENPTSSDLSSDAYFFAGINESATYFSGLPGWFYYDEPIRFASKLPVMTINTDGGYILDDVRIVANMGLIDNGSGVLNHPDDPLNEYEGRISIEIRGSSSKMFPKKSYSFETQTIIGDNNNVSLLGMPSENDWVLHAPYSDKSLMRNVICFGIYERMGYWAPRTRFIDLYLNDDYQGIYVLTEKIKRDKNRLDIAKITEEDVSEEDISGGYLLQYDRYEDLTVNEYWFSPVRPIYEASYMHFEYFDPSADELSPLQSGYIRDWINDLDALMSGAAYDDPLSGYRAYMDVESFVDYLIFHELNKDVDAYRLSSFFYKENDRDGGLLKAGPPWDYNLTFANSDYAGDVQETYNWLYNRTVSPYWWRRLMNDPWFENEVFCRWDSLYTNLYSEESVFEIMDSSLLVIDSSITKNFERWPVLGEYVWPNYFVADTHEEEIDFMKDWISDRLEWMDSQWGGRCIIAAVEEKLIEAAPSMRITPNPSDLSHSRVRFSAPLSGEYQLSLFDINGRQVYQQVYIALPGSKDIDLEDLSHLNDGIYLMRVRGENGFDEYLKLIKTR